MKKYTFLFIFICSLFSAKAVDDNTLRFNVELQPQFVFAGTQGKYKKSDGTRLGFSWGVNMDYFFVKNVALNVGLAHQIAGLKAQFTDTSFGGTFHQNYNFQTIQVPLSVKFKTNEFKSKITGYGQLGFCNYITISQRAKLLEKDFDYPSTLKKNIVDESTNNLNIYNVGLLVGGGIEYRIAERTAIFGGLEYKNALLNQIKTGKISPNDKVMMHSVSLKVGLVF